MLAKYVADQGLVPRDDPDFKVSEQNTGIAGSAFSRLPLGKRTTAIQAVVVLLYVDAPPAGATKLTDWVAAHADMVGRYYANELARRRDRRTAYRQDEPK